MRAWAILGCVAVTVMAALPMTASGQDVEFEMGRMNFGPVVTEEVDNFVRFGQDGGMETYYSIGLVNDRWYAALRLAPTSLYRWDTDDTDHQFGKNGADPTQSRFRYRVNGHTDDFIWSELVGGLYNEWGPFEGRIGGGLVQLAQTRHTFWGAKTSPKPIMELTVGVNYGYVSARCRASAVYVGEPFGRWSVLEHAARDVGDSSIKRTMKPLACGVSVGL